MGWMRKGFGLVIVMVVVLGWSQIGESKGYGVPYICKTFECPTYQVIHSQMDFEVRSYEDGMWMSTYPIDSASYKDAVRKGYDTLSTYLTGEHDQAAKIKMTAPIFINNFPSTGPRDTSSKHEKIDSSFVVHFYMPKNYHKNSLLSEKTHAKKFPRHRYVAVRRFQGFVDDSDVPTQTLSLRKSLENTPWASATIDSAHYSVAQYSSPYADECDAPFADGNLVYEVMLWFDM